MNLSVAIEIAKKAAEGKSLSGYFVASDGSVYINPNQSKLKAHAQKSKLTVYDVEKETVVYSPRKK